MDEIARMLIGTSPIAAVVLLLGTSALQIWQTDLKAANLKRNEIEKRLQAIEKQLGIVYTPDAPPS